MASTIADRPWEGLPAEVAGALRPELPGLADEIIAAISRGVPGYARPLEGPFGRALRLGVEEALRQFVAMVQDPAAGRERDVYVNLGRGEMRAGRSLDALLAAYRVGARVAWRRLAAAGERAGLEPRTLYLLAESIFAYIDELSADSIEGYAREQAAAAGEAQRRRRRLVGLLVQEPPADRAAIEAAAADAGWPLPRTLAALAVEGEPEDADRLAVRLGPDAIVAPGVPPAPVAGDGRVPAPPLVCVIVADPEAPGRKRQLEEALRGRRAALGPAVGWRDAALSFNRATTVLRLGTGSADRLLSADDCLLDILLQQDRRLAEDIAARALAPLAGETELSRRRLTDTLRAWLRHRGRTEEVARALHVHPQTVRYRLARLREVFGDELEDPDSRFELELALRTVPAGGE
jgi:PucR C-terminal helix-turn-helix domain